MHRSPARWLAPLALAAAFAATWIVADGGSSDEQDDSPKAVRSTETTTRGQTARQGARRRSYTVRPGDILGQIAAENGLSVRELEALNPGVDAQTLTPGQRLRLSR